MIMQRNDNDEENTMATATYRAAYWISDDEQAEVVLTTKRQSSLSDEDLRAVALAEAKRVGLDLCTGEILISNWSD